MIVYGRNRKSLCVSIEGINSESVQIKNVPRTYDQLRRNGAESWVATVRSSE